MASTITGTGYTKHLTESKGPIDVMNIDMNALQADIRKMAQQEIAESKKNGNNVSGDKLSGDLKQLMNTDLFSPNMTNLLNKEVDQIAREEAEKAAKAAKASGHGSTTVAESQRGNVRG